MTHRRIIFFGGNGHTADRLAPARAALARASMPVDLLDVPYPGFDDRPRAAGLEAFLDAVGDFVSATVPSQGPAVLYGTGIGGLIALCLRARRRALDVPMILQAPVLWGLERRWMPRLMRLGLARVALRRLFAWAPFQRHFVRRQFLTPLPDPRRQAFFAGYARCPAAPDLFDWFTPALLRDLERRFRERPDALRLISVWWGGHDHVVDPNELRLTEEVLGTKWPLRLFPDWGHYPMIDDPDGWARALAEATV